MAPWTVDHDMIVPLIKMGDSLSVNIHGVDQRIYAICFDKVVEKNSNKQRRPCSTDGICVHGDTTYFIEFKPLKEKDDILEILRCKALESIIVSPKLIGNTKRRELIIVVQDHRLTISKSSSKGISIPKKLEKYRMRDKYSQTLFYDDVSVKSCTEFVDFANRKLCRSTEDALKGILSDGSP